MDFRMRDILEEDAKQDGRLNKNNCIRPTADVQNSVCEYANICKLRTSILFSSVG